MLSTSNGQEAKNGWCYIGCPADYCCLKVELDDQHYYCGYCQKKVSNITARFRLQLQVADHTGASNFVIMEKQAGRYKVEVQRINNNGGGGSNWHWFKQIEAIIGHSSSGGSKAVSASGGNGGNGAIQLVESEPSADTATGNESSIVLGIANRYTRSSAAAAAFTSNLRSTKSSEPTLKWRRGVFKISSKSARGEGTSTSGGHQTYGTAGSVEIDVETQGKKTLDHLKLFYWCCTVNLLILELRLVIYYGDVL
ncbi:hypothetical protein LINPERHAP1_LOCUS10332 [Linum perenne]